MEYLGEIELENNYKRICKAFSESGATPNFINNFKINEKAIWYICYKNNHTLLKKIYRLNPYFKNLVFEIVKQKNMEELIKWCENN